MSDFPTLVKPPPLDPSKSQIEGLLELTQLGPIDPVRTQALGSNVADLAQDLYTNTRPLWRPPGARGLYGGAVIAQCLAAAHKSVPSDFLIHSMHCYFVLAGNPDVPVIYHVERIRSGRSFATRTVQARQKGKVIFTTTMSFMKEGSGGKKLVEHFRPMPFVPGPEEDSLGSVLSGDRGPVVSRSIDIWNSGFDNTFISGCSQT